jgi:DNA segregation ATPase FtsK/SpoIIIE-like protein
LKKADLKELQRDTRYYSKVCQQTLHRLRFSYLLRKESRPSTAESLATGKGAWQKVNFDRAYGDQDVLWLHVSYEMPFGTKLTDLINQEYVEQELCLSCQRPVEIKWSNKAGVWIVIYRRGSPSGVPSLFRFKDALPLIQLDAHPLEFVIGAADKRLIKTTNLERTDHLLVGGATHGGKSVFMNQMLLTLLWRNHPDRLWVYLYDMKRGNELAGYRDLPHVKEFIKTPEECIDSIQRLHDEMIRRSDFIFDKDKSVHAWNKRHKNQPDKQFPYIVLMFDEFATIAAYKDKKGNRSIAKEAHWLIGQIVAQGRSNGIYAVLSTQTPVAEVFPTLIKSNCPTRIAFNCSHFTDSVNIIGAGGAEGLRPVGRAIFLMDGRKNIIQAPFVTDGQVKNIIRQIRRKWSDNPLPVAPQYDWLEVLRYSRDFLAGSLSETELYNYFSGDIPRSELRAWLSTIEERGVQFDGDSYEVQPAAGSRARQLIICEPKSNGNSAPHADRGENQETVDT